MTEPRRDDEYDDSDRIPTQAELDAEDLAELARTSKDRDRANLYPTPLDDPGPVPVPLALHARVAWWGAAIAGLCSVVYGFLNLGLITDALRQRLAEGVALDPNNAGPAEQVDSTATFFPPFMLVMIVILLAIQYPLLVATATHHSRTCRNLFLTVVLVNLLCIPVGNDLLFRYPDVWSTMSVIAWIQFGFLVLAALITLRKPVNQWLPASTRMRPSRVFRG